MVTRSVSEEESGFNVASQFILAHASGYHQFELHGNFGAIVKRLLFVILIWLSVSCFVSAERPAWTTSKVQGTPTPPMPFRTELVFGGHRFQKPVELSNAPTTDSMFLLEQGGKIFELESEDDAEPRLLGDLSKHHDEFMSAYGLAFHPNFESNRQIFVCYIYKSDDMDVGTVLAKMRLSKEKPLRIEPDSKQVLYTWRRGGHNGGSLQFGPDGYLYISAGDSEAPFPPDKLKAGQDLTNVLSTITRIDVDRTEKEKSYAVPADNPFVKLPNARPEIFAYGFRNPWRMAFDRETGDLWVGDVGWELWEMIYCVESGGNYGWSIVEGPQSIDPDGKRGPTEIIPPAAAHKHTESRSITGGQVYYGDRLPELRGEYIYGDHVTGRIWKLRKNGDKFEGPTQIAREPIQVICFGQHRNGEIYIVDYQGTVHRLVRNEREQNAEFPQTLGASGLFTAAEKHELAEGVLPYEIIAEPWMDGATASRFVAIPGQQQIGVYTARGGHANWDGKHPGSWKFPENSVLGKTISYKGRRIETQLMHYDGQAWLAYTYLWNAEQTDATLAEDRSKTITIDLGDEKKHWSISNRGDCMVCHSNANDMLLGFKPSQLRKEIEGHEDQLGHLYEMGLFEQEPKREKTLVSPHDDSANLQDRARAYLHLNCAHCHRTQGGGSVPMNAVYSADNKATRMLDERPSQGDFGIDDARVVAPGDPYRSVLLYRFAKLGPGHMPKLGGLEIDQQGATLLHDWIASLEKDNAQASSRLQQLRQAAPDDGKLTELLSDPANALAAAHAYRSWGMDQAQRDRLLKLSRELPSTSKDLFEGFIPIEDRVKRLGPNIDTKQILSEAGDPDDGRTLFHTSSLSCKNCHAAEADKESTGPNLATLAKERYERSSLLESILHPSKVIDAKYRTQIIQTDDGNVITAVVTKETDETVFLRDVENKPYEVAKDEIEFRKVSEVSLMPEKLLEPLTLKQAQDLIEFLHSLK